MKKNDFLKEQGKNEFYEKESEQREEEEQLIENQRKQYFYYYSRLESEEENINPYANRLVRSPYGNNFVKNPYGNNFVKDPYGNNFVKSPYRNNFVKSPYGNNFTKNPNVPRVHAKLKVSSPNDPCELEADRFAENVLNRKESEKQTDFHQNENSINAKSTSGITVDTETESRINGLSSGHPLPDSERSFYEERFGSDFSKVRIHDDQESHELAKNLNAKAFTKETDIVFGEGEYRPDTDEGRKLLAHELVHVEQEVKNNMTENIFCAEKGGKRKITGSDPLIDGITKQSAQADIDMAIERVNKALKDPNISSERKSALRGWLKVVKRGWRFRVILSFFNIIPDLIEFYRLWQRAKTSGRSINEQMNEEFKKEGPYLFVPFMIENPYYIEGGKGPKT